MTAKPRASWLPQQSATYPGLCLPTGMTHSLDSKASDHTLPMINKNKKPLVILYQRTKEVEGQLLRQTELYIQTEISSPYQLPRVKIRKAHTTLRHFPQTKNHTFWNTTWECSRLCSEYSLTCSTITP